MLSHGRGVLFVEYCQGGDLFDLIKAKGALRPNYCRQIISEICSALVAAKQKQIFHRDIKLENVFLDKHGKVKLGDWGLSSFRSHSNALRGTLSSIAPELVSGDGRTAHDLEKADTWGLGVVLFTIFFGRPPYETPQVKENAEKGRYLECDPFLRMILEKKWEAFWLYQNRLCDGTNADVKRLLESMLSVDPNERPTFENIASHPWLVPARSPTSIARRDEGIIELCAEFETKCGSTNMHTL
jgi:serine/threonine protein kinase